jgi:Holliday junction resolvasome RuvABC DNA-binding subunit
VREALAGLGYGPDEVRDALAALPDDAPDDPSALLRLALRSLAVGT